MIPLDWETRERRLAEVLSAHFPHADGPSIRNFARDIGDSYSAASTLQTVERKDISPKKDRETLAKASGHMRRAIGSIERLGLHAGEALREPVSEMIKHHTELRFLGRPSITETLAITIDTLDELAKAFDNAQSAIRDDAKSWRGTLSKTHNATTKGGRPPETQGLFTAQSCRIAFEAATGNRATVSSRPVSADAYEKYGPFLELVRDVFRVLEITSSPENAAEQAVGSG